MRYTAPSLVFDGPDGQKLETGGFQPIEAYDVVIANLDPTLERRPPANDPVEVLSAFPYALTTAAPSSSTPAAPAVRWALATLVLVCAFAIPATAVAAPGDEPARPTEDQAFPGLARQARAATAKLSTRPVDTQPTTPRAQPTDPGFDWGSAAAGAGRHRRPDRPRLAGRPGTQHPPTHADRALSVARPPHPVRGRPNAFSRESGGPSSAHDPRRLVMTLSSYTRIAASRVPWPR